jgi:hypothetical protein
MERECEIAATMELASVSGVVLSPGQVAEKLLSYDTAGAPTADNPIWEVLREPRSMTRPSSEPTTGSAPSRGSLG